LTRNKGGGAVGERKGLQEHRGGRQGGGGTDPAGRFTGTPTAAHRTALASAEAKWRALDATLGKKLGTAHTTSGSKKKTNGIT